MRAVTPPSMAEEGGWQEQGHGAGTLPVLGRWGRPATVPGKGAGARSAGAVSGRALPGVSTAVLIYTLAGAAGHTGTAQRPPAPETRSPAPCPCPRRRSQVRGYRGGVWGHQSSRWLSVLLSAGPRRTPSLQRKANMDEIVPVFEGELAPNLLAREPAFLPRQRRSPALITLLPDEQ